LENSNTRTSYGFLWERIAEIDERKNGVVIYPAQVRAVFLSAAFCCGRFGENLGRIQFSGRQNGRNKWYHIK